MCPGIHGGIRLATYLAYGKCDKPQYARNAPSAHGTKRVAVSKTRSTELRGDPSRGAAARLTPPRSASIIKGSTHTYPVEACASATGRPNPKNNTSSSAASVTAATETVHRISKPTPN